MKQINKLRGNTLLLSTSLSLVTIFIYLLIFSLLLCFSLFLNFRQLYCLFLFSRKFSTLDGDVSFDQNGEDTKFKIIYTYNLENILNIH